MKNDSTTVFRIDDPHAVLTKELLQLEYCENRLSDKKIAEKYGIGSKATVWNRRKFWGIENAHKTKSNNNAAKNREFSIAKDDAVQFLSAGLSYEEIAQKIGCSRMVAYRRLKELGLIEDCEQEVRKLKWHESLSNEQRRFLLGCLLGDGSITPAGMFQCSHSHKQIQYITYKFEMLRSLISPRFKLGNNRIQNHQNGKVYYSHYLRTMNNEFLKEMRLAFYPNGTKIFPYDYLMSSEFDAFSLAVWFMDDGSRKGNTANIHTFSFGYAGNADVMKFLYERFGIKSKLETSHEERRGADCRNFISIHDESADLFFKLVSPYILPLFHYKLPSKWRPITSSATLYSSIV